MSDWLRAVEEARAEAHEQTAHLREAMKRRRVRQAVSGPRVTEQMITAARGAHENFLLAIQIEEEFSDADVYAAIYRAMRLHRPLSEGPQP